MILSLFPTGTGSISAADVRQYLNDILDSNILQSSAAVTDTLSVVPLLSSDVDENAPRKPTNVGGTVYQLPQVSTIKEGVSLVIINKLVVNVNISLFGGDTATGVFQIDKPGLWLVTADPANNTWLSVFNLFSDLIEFFNTNETDKEKELRPTGTGDVEWINVNPDVITVLSEDDFPDPIGGISTLEEKTYLISTAGVITISFRLKYVNSRTVVTGFGRLVSVLQFTNTSASDANIINDTNISVSLTDLFIESPNAPMFDCVGGSNALFTVSDCILDNCTDLGKIDGFVRSQVNNGTLIGFNVTGGLDILGSNGTILLQDMQSAANVATPTFSMNDAGFTCTNLNLSNITATLLTGSNQFADIDPTKVTGGLIADSAFTGSNPVGSAIDNTTVNFVIDRVQGVESTRKIGAVNLSSPTTVTIITQSVPVEVGGTWMAATVSQFSLLIPGMQFDGVTSQDVFQLIAVISGTKPGGTGSNIYSGAIYNNDVLEANSLDISEISDKGGRLIMSVFTTLATLEHLTLYVTNEDNTVDLDIISAEISTFRVQ